MSYNQKITILFLTSIVPYTMLYAMSRGEELYHAAATGQVFQVQRFLTQKVDPNFTMGNGETAIIPAAKHNHVDVVDALIVFGADVNATDPNGWTALMLASRYGHMDVVQSLLQAEADPNITNTFGGFALAEAAKNGMNQVTETLLLFEANVDKADKHGRTALMHASRYGHINVARTLLRAGADLHYVSRYGDSPLIEAAQIPLLKTRFQTRCIKTTDEMQEYAARLQHEKSIKEQLTLEYIRRGAPIHEEQYMRARGVPRSMIAFIMQNKVQLRRRRTSSLNGHNLPRELSELILEIDGM